MPKKQLASLAAKNAERSRYGLPPSKAASRYLYDTDEELEHAQAHGRVPDHDPVKEPCVDHPIRCNCCGSCCDPVVLPYSQLEAKTRFSHQLDPVTARWVQEDLTPMPRREVRAREPWLLSGLFTGKREDEIIPFFFSCRHFDPEARRCNNHANRPPACRDYPWGDQPPEPRQALPAACSFNADVGRPVLLRAKPR